MFSVSHYIPMDNISTYPIVFNGNNACGNKKGAGMIFKFSPPKPSANFNEKFLPSMQWDFTKRNVRNVNRTVGWARTFFIRSLQVRVGFFEKVSPATVVRTFPADSFCNWFLGKAVTGCYRPFFRGVGTCFPANQSLEGSNRPLLVDTMTIRSQPGPAWWDQVFKFFWSIPPEIHGGLLLFLGIIEWGCWILRWRNYIYTHIWVNFITTEPCSPEPWNHGLFQGNHPQMAQQFRWLTYYNLPRLGNNHPYQPFLWY